MLHRTFFVLPLLFLLLACGAVSASPNTSAPITKNLGEYLRTCDERHDAIDDWERKQARNIEDEWIDGRRGLMQSGAKFGQVREEAQSMRQELRDNCEAKKPSPEIAAKRLGIPGCIDADALRNIRAEFRADASSAEEKYGGQRLCFQGEVTSVLGAAALEGTTMGSVSASVDGGPGFVIPYYVKNGKREGWVGSASKGRVIKAECTVGRVSPIILEDCEFAGGR